MLVSLSLFLAISFHSRPYYTGSDIVFLFAWTPFVLAGAAGAPALDTWLADRGRHRRRDGGRPRDGAVSRGAVIGIVAAGSAVLIGAVAGLGRAVGPGDTERRRHHGDDRPPDDRPRRRRRRHHRPPADPPRTPPRRRPRARPSAPPSQVPVGGSAAFNDPTTGDPSLVIQQTADDFEAFDAICPHAGCTVAYQASAEHHRLPVPRLRSSTPKTGAVIQGPATSGLTPIKVIKGSNGDLYVV